MIKLLLKLMLVGVLCMLSMQARAGRSCEEKGQASKTMETAIESAVKLNKALDATGAKIVLVARVGQDLSQYNLKYSHAAFVYKKDNAWEVFHELNTCGTNNSSLYIEGLANFFLDDMFSYDSKVFVPSESVQAQLYEKLVVNNAYAKGLHHSQYNMLSWPFSTKYQNSNQWVLEVVAGALAPNEVYNRQQAQAWLEKSNYQGTTLRIGAGKRLGARLFKANIAFDDQPFDERMAGSITTVTVDSVYDFLQLQDSAGKFVEIK